jgi:hypothetical protein
MLCQKNIIQFFVFLFVVVVIPVYLYSQGVAGLQTEGNTNPNLISTTDSKNTNTNSSFTNINNRNDNSETKYYLLKTNYIIEGIARHDGKNYDIKTSYGSIKIPSQNVAFIGQSRDEIYIYKKNLLNPLDKADSLKFAEWCVGNNFLQEAITEYENAMQLANDNVTTSIIKQRILTIKKNIAAANKTGNNFKSDENEIEDDLGLGLSSDMKTSNERVKVVKKLTDNFKRHVQPILLRNCAVSGCHSVGRDRVEGISASKFLLLPSSDNTVVNFSQENLNTCLLYVDFEYPMRSRLLNYVIVPHGRYTPSFNVESDEYNKVVSWVQLMVKNMPLIKSSEFAGLFSNARFNSLSRVEDGKYITADLNTATSSSNNFDNVVPNPVTNLPAGFKEVVNLQNQATNKQNPINVTKNPTPNPTNTINPNLTNTTEKEIDQTDPTIFNKIYHPKSIQ